MPVRPDEVTEAFEVLDAYRGAHNVPLTKVNVGLRQFIRSEGVGIQVIPPAQRLKRRGPILAKLVRESTMRLSQMEDVAGARCVLVDRKAVERVLVRITNTWDVVRKPDDYAAAPKKDGYRALHVVVRRDSRLVEIQLRTLAQNLWAEKVDDLTARSGFDVKHGEGPTDLMEDLSQLSAVLAAIGDGSAKGGPAALGEVETLITRIDCYLPGGTA